MAVAVTRSTFSGTATPPTGFVTMTGHSDMVEGSGVAKPTNYSATCSMVYNTITSTADDRIIFTLGGSILNDFSVVFRADANTDHDEAGMVYFAIGSSTAPAWDNPDTIELRKYTGGTPTTITPTNTANNVASRWPAIVGTKVSLRDTRLSAGDKIEVQWMDDQVIVKVNDMVRMHEEFTGRDATGYHGIITYAGSSTDQSYDTYKSGSMVARYVSKDASASDSNSGADPTTNAWATIAKGYNAQVAGEVCFVLAGTYTDTCTFTSSAKPRAATAWEEPVMVMKKADEVLTETTRSITTADTDILHVYTYGLTIRVSSGASCYGIQQAYDSYAHAIQGCAIYDTNEHGIKLGNTVTATNGDNRIWDNHIQGGGRTVGAQKHAIYIWGQGSSVKFNTLDGSVKNIGQSEGYGVHLFYSADTTANDGTEVSYNIIKNFNGTGSTAISGVLLAHGNDMVCKDNVVHDSVNGISDFSGCTDSVIYNNTCHGNTYRGVWLAASGACSGSIAYNNTAYQNGLNGILITANSTNAIVRNNTSYQNGGLAYSDAKDLTDSGTTSTVSSNWLTSTGDPGFADPVNGDFGLSAGASSATGAATLSSPMEALDALGYARPQGASWGYGAFELPDPADPPDINVEATISGNVDTAINPSLTCTGNANSVLEFWIDSMTGSVVVNAPTASGTAVVEGGS